MTEHVCCPVCVRVAELLAAEGKHDPMYDQYLGGRCCCCAPQVASPKPQAEGQSWAS